MKNIFNHSCKSLKVQNLLILRKISSYGYFNSIDCEYIKI